MGRTQYELGTAFPAGLGAMPVLPGPRALAPDLRMELSQEIREKHRIAIGFRITGTHTGDTSGLPASGGAIDVEGTAFLTLSGGKVTEVWTVFDALALAVQTGAAEAPAWWPGRS